MNLCERHSLLSFAASHAGVRFENWSLLQRIHRCSRSNGTKSGDAAKRRLDQILLLLNGKVLILKTCLIRQLVNTINQDSIPMSPATLQNLMFACPPLMELAPQSLLADLTRCTKA